MKTTRITHKPFALILALTFAVFLIIIFTYPTEALTKGKELTGAEVYAANCGKCHSERYPSERTDEEWKLLVNHMRVRAGLTAKEAKAVLEYLQENNE
jgi:cytochrome c1